MAYATEANFIDTFSYQEAVDLTNLDDATSEDINSVTLQRALNDASATIDSYLRGRYSLPLSPVPSVLISVCLDIARYRLHRNNPSDDIRQRYEDAIRWLEQVAKGLIQLAEATPETSAGMPDFFTPGRTFSSESMRDFGL